MLPLLSIIFLSVHESPFRLTKNDDNSVATSDDIHPLPFTFATATADDVHPLPPLVDSQSVRSPVDGSLIKYSKSDEDVEGKVNKNTNDKADNSAKTNPDVNLDVNPDVNPVNPDINPDDVDTHSNMNTNTDVWPKDKATSKGVKMKQGKEKEEKIETINEKNDNKTGKKEKREVSGGNEEEIPKKKKITSKKKRNFHKGHEKWH